MSVVRWVSVLSVSGFLGTLGYYLVQPGFRWTGVASFPGLGGLAVLGGTGVVSQRERVVAACACGLLLVGFWQAALWMYILPMVAILVVASVVVASQEPTKTLLSG